jgi:thymidylate kinase
LIVIEGPDGAGKSTLARELSSSWGFSIAGTRGPDDNVREKVYTALGQAVSGEGPIKIYDRLFFSELVYGRILRGKLLFNAIESLYIKRMLAALRCPVIFCLPPYEEVLKNIQNSDQMDGVEDNIHKIYKAYEGYFTGFGGNRMISDYTRGVDKNPDVIQRYLQERKERTWA